MRRNLLFAAVVAVFCLTAPLSKAGGILVGQCVEFTACWTSNSVTPWSDSLSSGDLAALQTMAASATVPFIVEQNTATTIRLGVTTITFTTSGAPVVETLGEFNGSGAYNDPCPATLPYCETDTVGTFIIPANALSAIISGTFGNSSVSNSAGECLYLGATGVCTLDGTVTPEPSSGLLLFSAFGAIVLAARKRNAFRGDGASRMKL
jgi:hypothetical protein